MGIATKTLASITVLLLSVAPAIAQLSITQPVSQGSVMITVTPNEPVTEECKTASEAEFEKLFAQLACLELPTFSQRINCFFDVAVAAFESEASCQD